MLDASKVGARNKAFVQLGWHRISGVDGWQIQVSQDRASKAYGRWSSVRV